MPYSQLSPYWRIFMRNLKVTAFHYSRNTISFFDLNFVIAWHQAMPSIWGCYEKSPLLILTMFSVNVFFFFSFVTITYKSILNPKGYLDSQMCHLCPRKKVFHVFIISVLGDACFLKASWDNVLLLPLLPAFPCQHGPPFLGTAFLLSSSTFLKPQAA